jgi:hypothetical protein
MSKHEIVRITCKILAVYLIVQGINASLNAFSSYFIILDYPISEMMLNVVLPFFFLIIFGILIWVFSGKLSVFMVKGKVHSEKELGIKADDLQRVAISVLGLFFTGTSLPKLISSWMNYTNFTARNEMFDATRLLPEAFGNLTQLIIGLGIFFGSQGLVNILKYLRYIGVKNTEKDY